MEDRSAFSQDDRPPPRPTVAERDEVRLVQRVAAGEMSAFELLYRMYHPRLARFLERMTRRTGLVEEVLNDTMLVVWRKAAQYNGRSKVSTWIFAIAYRTALKALARSEEVVDDGDADARADPADGPEALAGRVQLQQRLARALDSLSVHHRAVVDLTYFHGMGYREIAEVMDCPVDTVKTRMFHARRRLRGLLEGQREDWL